MYVCMCIYICVYIFIFINVYQKKLCIRIYECVCIYSYTHVHMCIYNVYMLSVMLNIHIFMHIYKYMCSSVSLYSFLQNILDVYTLFADIYTYIYACMHAQLCVIWCGVVNAKLSDVNQKIYTIHILHIHIYIYMYIC